MRKVQNGFYFFREAGTEILNLALEASLSKNVLSLQSSSQLPPHSIIGTKIVAMILIVLVQTGSLSSSGEARI